LARGSPAQITLVLGGTRSGKSSFAEQLALRSISPVVYLATATPDDPEMAARIAAHQAARPTDWVTVEARREVGAALSNMAAPWQTVLLDCVTLLASNVLLDEEQEAEQPHVLVARAEAVLEAEFTNLIAEVERRHGHLILVSNEVGSGVVPPYPLGRAFQDLLGGANQRLARAADEVYLLVAGLPMEIKHLAGRAAP
jgi:adenosylcobinamide kinase / adenosylcobinamide-phosphate guanylyltransferase